MYFNYLSVILKDRKISRHKFALLAQVPTCYIYKIVAGEILPCPAWRKRICEFLDMPESDIWPLNEEKEAEIDANSTKG